jgi:hypothetical protein
MLCTFSLYFCCTLLVLHFLDEDCPCCTVFTVLPLIAACCLYNFTHPCMYTSAFSPWAEVSLQLVVVVLWVTPVSVCLCLGSYSCNIQPFLLRLSLSLSSIFTHIHCCQPAIVLQYPLIVVVGQPTPVLQWRCPAGLSHSMCRRQSLCIPPPLLACYCSTASPYCYFCVALYNFAMTLSFQPIPLLHVKVVFFNPLACSKFAYYLYSVLPASTLLMFVFVPIYSHISLTQLCGIMAGGC